jgi:uncharacterized protein with von Willebrand factor type A (vWA) domain
VAYLLHNLLHFERLLHALGLDVHAGRMPDVVSALEHIDLARRSDVYFTLQSLLIHRPQDLAAFDEAFRVFWRQPASEEFSRMRDALGRQYRRGTPKVQETSGEAPAADTSNPAQTAASERVERIAAMTYSAREVSRVKDFAQYTEEELQQAQAMLAALTWDVGTRQTRRWSPARGRALDLRRIVRRNIRYGGEWIALPTRDRRSKRRPLVLICDVSGSMERYARMLLHFIHSLAGGLDRVEAFLFSTRLTRVTRELKRRHAPDDVPKIPPRIPGWGGGTQIGEALRTFNVRWARRVLGHGPVVLLISDGWDRGEPDVLAREMRRLQRSCHRLIWLNPLLGSPDYQPLTRGMQAALPFVDDFLPVHNLASLGMLAEHLNQLPPRRGARRRPSRQAGLSRPTRLV